MTSGVKRYELISYALKSRLYWKINKFLSQMKKTCAKFNSTKMDGAHVDQGKNIFKEIFHHNHHGAVDEVYGLEMEIPKSY